jgi:hypothetical protein
MNRAGGGLLGFGDPIDERGGHAGAFAPRLMSCPAEKL